MKKKEKFKCEYCPSVLSTNYNRESHMKRNKSCLKIRGIVSPLILTSKTCNTCGFVCSANSVLNCHVCRPEHIDLINKINLANQMIFKLNEENIGIKLNHTDIMSDKNNKYIKLEKKTNEYEIEIKKLNNEIFNLDRDNSLTIEQLNFKLEKYENKIFDIASKPNNITTTNNNNNTTNTNNIQMLIQKLIPVSEHEMIKLFETVCTKETILNGVDTLMEELGSAMKNNHMLCTDTNRNKLTYKNEENEVIKDTNGKVILPQLCKWGQPTIDKGYMEAEKVIKERTNNEDEYDCQMRYLDKEWQYKYPRIKSGIGDKESKKAAKILAERVKVSE
jgi:hypothetical protein